VSTDRLEVLLLEVANEIDYPPTPELSFRVAHRIARDPLAPERRSRRRWLRPALAIGIVVVLIGFFTLAFSPTARRAVADFLGVVGIRISVGTEKSSTRDLPGPDLDDIDLGEEVSLGEAGSRAGFDVKVPNESVQGGWHRTVFFDPAIGESGMVSLAYQSDGTDDEEVEFLITQFEASVDETFFKKTLAMGSDVRFVDAPGTTGYWVSGEPHLFYYLESDGDLREESLRLAGNVLLWEAGGVTYRVEGARSLVEAQRIAASLR
jgi:hypothetical protein